ncbi:MAG TPA: ATP-binding protein [Patescibacteria group bacterium]|nr:ATP-binding protein [Patescibacteria group bacterium]
MKILHMSIQEITFEDIENFCEEKNREGIQLDYKVDLTEGSLAKHFAAFSNTRGGIIVIGVQQNKDTGLPESWKGIPITNSAKYIERINQWATSITPVPHFQVTATSEKKGKVFVILRIYEGDKPPYFVDYNPNIYERTGDITSLIKHASPDLVEILFNKKEKAELARLNLFKRAEDVYQHALRQEDIKRKRLIDEAKQKQDGSENSYYQKNLGTDAVMSTITLQPFFPIKALVNPSEIVEKISDYTVDKSTYTSFPERSLNPMPDGAYHFSHNYAGNLQCHQIYSYGLMFFAQNIRDVHRNTNTIYLSYIAGKIFVFLSSARNFYKLCNYQGVLIGSLKIDNMIGKMVEEISSNGRLMFPKNIESFLPTYNWEIETDTDILNDNDEFYSYYMQLLRKIYWGLGIRDMNEGLIKEFLQNNRLTL